VEARLKCCGEVHSIDVAAACTWHDAKDDWAILRFEGVVAAQVAAARLARLESRTTARRWSTFGFTDARPDAGEPHSGDIRLVDGDVIHLFGEEDAAGAGGLIAGASGGPCVFEGYVVGILLSALQNKKREGIHGAVYAFPILRIAEACGLELAPGPQVFEAEVALLLERVRGAALMKLAQALNVPHTESDEGLRVRAARGLLVANAQQMLDALVACRAGVDKPMAIVEMVLSHAVRDECATAVGRCLRQHDAQSPVRGVATSATTELAVRLLVARALQVYDVAEERYAYVENRSFGNEAWARRIREKILEVLRFDEENFETPEELNETLNAWKGIVAFPFNANAVPVAEIERYEGARPLARVADEDLNTFALEGFEVVPSFADSGTEKDLERSHREARMALERRPRRE
jgi:hypothetical protein